jgi:hypothetical protein
MSVTAYALTTLANTKDYLGITTDEEDLLLDALIDRATDFIERYCNRKLKTRAYTREIYWGNGRQKLVLEQYPVTAVSRVSTGRINAFSIKNTTATNHATAEITATALSLVADGGAATSLILASYATINLLLAAVPIAWTATLLSTTYGTRKATDLLVRPAMYCLSPDLAYGEIPDDELTDYYLLAPTEARNYGILHYPSGFTAGQEFFVDYTAGYTAPIPYALEAACLELVKFKYDQKENDQALKSETLGDYSYTIGDFKRALPDDTKEALDLFKRRII